MIKNIIFDVGNVLMSYDPISYMRRLGFDEITVKAVNDAMFGHPFWNESDRGVLTSQQLLEGFISHAPEWESQIRIAYENVGDCIHLMEHALPWIQELKEQGYHLYILSNYAEDTYEKTKEKMKFLPFMDGVVFSYRIKKIKPEPEIYQYLCETYGLKPEECIFFDDRQENIDAAKKEGICGICFTTYEQAKKDLNKNL